MNPSRLTLASVGTIAAYLLLGVVGTAAVALALLYTLQPVQRGVYRLFYLQAGPSAATQAAILTHFLVAGFLALSAVLLAGDLLSDRLAHRTPLAKAVVVLFVLLLGFLVVSVAGLAAFLTALVFVAVAVLTVPLLLRYRYGVRSGAVPAFVGGIPVLVVLLLLTGFGLGWGWGYVMSAREVPAAAVSGPADADFADVPRIRDDLFSGDCSTGPDGRRVCRLYLRGYEHETRAARFMARYGVRCPYQKTQAGRAESFIAARDGSYYRVTCQPHGD